MREELLVPVRAVEGPAGAVVDVAVVVEERAVGHRLLLRGKHRELRRLEQVVVDPVGGERHGEARHLRDPGSLGRQVEDLAEQEEDLGAAEAVADHLLVAHRRTGEEHGHAAGLEWRLAADRCEQLRQVDAAAAGDAAHERLLADHAVPRQRVAVGEEVLVQIPVEEDVRVHEADDVVGLDVGGDGVERLDAVQRHVAAASLREIDVVALRLVGSGDRADAVKVEQAAELRGEGGVVVADDDGDVPAGRQLADERLAENRQLPVEVDAVLDAEDETDARAVEARRRERRARRIGASGKRHGSVLDQVETAEGQQRRSHVGEHLDVCAVIAGAQFREDGSGGKGAAGSGTGSGAPFGTAGSGIGTGGGGTGVIAFGSADAPKFLHRIVPQYPPAARMRREEGRVMLKLTIDEKGTLMNVEVVESTGSDFADAAVDAAKRSRFTPARRNNAPILSVALLPIRFTLR